MPGVEGVDGKQRDVTPGCTAPDWPHRGALSAAVRGARGKAQGGRCFTELKKPQSAGCVQLHVAQLTVTQTKQ